MVRRNLTGSFPEKTPAEIRKIERRSYRFLSDIIIETLWLATISRRSIMRRMRFSNPEEVAKVLLEGRSISLFLGHLGCWEWVSSLPLWLPEGVVSGQVYHKLNNKTMDKFLLHSRERMGAECIEMRGVARRVGQLTEKVSIIGYIADHSPRRHQARYFVPFLGRETPVLTGPEKITLKYGFEAWYLDIRRIKRGIYDAEFIRMNTEKGVTDQYFRLLEASILRQPEIYLWTHNRFKYARRRN